MCEDIRTPNSDVRMFCFRSTSTVRPIRPCGPWPIGLARGGFAPRCRARRRGRHRTPTRNAKPPPPRCMRRRGIRGCPPSACTPDRGCRVGGVDAVFGEELVQRGDLVHAVEVHLGDAQPLQSRAEQVAVAARDDAHLIAAAYGVRYGIAVLGVVLADEVAAPLDRHDAAVGHYAVHVEHESPRAGYIFFEVSHI